MKIFRSILRATCTGVTAVIILSTLVLIGIQGASADATVDHATQSVLVVADGNAIRLQPWSAGTIRVEAAPGQTIPAKQSLAVIATPNASGWDVQETDDNVSLKGPRMTAVVDKKTGLVSFLDVSGKTLLQQSAWTFSPAQNPARDALNVGASFHRSPGEHFYGGGVVNELRQPTTHLQLSNGNTQIRIPILYSNLGYSIFWDNASRGDLNLTPDQVSWHGLAGDLADYYVMAGPTADQAVAEYRNLTGAAPLFPKWAYGFWFSKNKFDNQQQILDAAKKFRDEQVPVDALVQDYFYWKPSSDSHDWTDWGSHHYVEDRYPDVKGMINTLHTEDNIHFMGVIWAKFDPDTDHAKELEAAYALNPPLADWAGSTLQYYNPFDKTAREIYGRQVMDSLLSLGQDAFWMDGAEPEADLNKYAALDSDGTPISRIMDAFPLMHTTAVYDAQRAATSDKRVFLLPRSSWAGEQRNAAANWTGDIHQEWKVLAWQIEGLQNYSVAGLPYITTDVGGYSADDAPGESDRELFLRWFEWGTFCPIYRVHGVARPFPWEYGPEGEAIIKKFDLLRYRLMPYIYTEGARITQSSGTLMRPLVMDFQDDAKALDTWDEFMFGPAILVSPVYKNHADEVDALDQWADKDGKSGGVTATFLTTGNELSARMDLKQAVTGFHFDDLTPEQKNAKKLRIEGTYTPDQDGKYKLVLGSYDHQHTLTVDGQPVTPDVPGGNEVFTEFPLTGKAGTPLHLTLETNDRRPILRITRVPTGPQHRDVYLPGKGDWYDFWSGERTAGGQTLNVETPIDSIPLFVRAGSILPMGPEIQYADESPGAPIELRVYRGANGAYSLYEDEGNNYNYEKGAFAHIPITWNETAQTLTIGAREGSFPGMIAQRTFHIVWVGPGHGTGEDVTAKGNADVSYDGHAVTVAAPPATGR